VSRLGSITAFTAEAAVWVAGAALIAGVAGMHLSVDLPAINILPAASASPPPSPAASTQPVVKFKAFLAKPTLQFSATIDNAVTISGANILTHETITGTASYRSGDASSSLTNTILGVTKTEDQVMLGKTTYLRENGGKWTKRDRVPADTAGTPEMLSPTQTFSDAGLATKNGVQLHRIEDADTTAFGTALQAGGTGTHYQLTLVFWVADEGTPAAIEVGGTYQDTVNEAPVTVTLDEQWTITATTGVTITAPS
jgi:hypothetical protein